MNAVARSTDEIKKYYRNTYYDYRVVWTGRRTLAYHFGFYDEKARHHAAALKRSNAVVAEAAALKPGDHVLDAGCGVGGTALWMAADCGVTVRGVTLSERQVARAKRAADERGMSDVVSFHCEDFTAVNAPDESFDAIVIIESLCHLADKSAFFQEAFRLLKPGGKVVVADYMRVRDDASERETRIMEQWRDGWSISDLGTPEGHDQAARAAGFSDTLVRDVTQNMRPSLRRLYYLTYLGWPLSLLFRMMKIRNESGHPNVVASHRQYQALNRGLWRFIHFTATK